MVQIEKLGKPGVYIISDMFASAAKAGGEANFMPAIRTVQIPEVEWRPLINAKTGEELKPLVLGAIDGIINALTSPLTKEEEKPTNIEATTERLTVTGKDYVDAAEAVNQLFLERTWSDGMSIVPPTEEAVQRMLKGTSRSPDEVIGTVAPVGGKATVEKIAINAVMGGAKPEYLPVIIKAMEVMTHDNWDLTHVQASTGGSAPMVVLSGPIATELNVNSGVNMFGYGWRANATIGRSIRLSLINLGHNWPGINRMARVGQPGEFTNWTIAELSSSPWGPLGVDFGYKPTDSTVAVLGVEEGYGLASGSEPLQILESIAKTMEQEFRPYHFASYGQSYYNIVMGLTHANSLAKAGWTKDKIRSWLYERARVSYSIFAQQDRLKLKQNIQQGYIPKIWDVEDINAQLPVVIKPDNIWIIVAGSEQTGTLVFQDVRFKRGIRILDGATLTKAGR
jgi:hypothetical protein